MCVLSGILQITLSSAKAFMLCIIRKRYSNDIASLHDYRRVVIDVAGNE